MCGGCSLRGDGTCIVRELITSSTRVWCNWFLPGAPRRGAIASPLSSPPHPLSLHLTHYLRYTSSALIARLPRLNKFTQDSPQATVSTSSYLSNMSSGEGRNRGNGGNGGRNRGNGEGPRHGRGRLRVGRLRPPRDPDLKRGRAAVFPLWADPHSALVICPRITASVLSHWTRPV